MFRIKITIRDKNCDDNPQQVIEQLRVKVSLIECFQSPFKCFSKEECALQEKFKHNKVDFICFSLNAIFTTTQDIAAGRLN